MVWYSYLLKNFPQFVVIHTVKGFGIVSEAKVDVFLELSCFIDDPVDVGNLISGSSVFSTSSLYIWKFLVHILPKPSLQDFEHNLAEIKASACNVGDPGSIPGSALSSGEGNGNSLQYSCLENPMDRGILQARVRGFLKEVDRT